MIIMNNCSVAYNNNITIPVFYTKVKFYFRQIGCIKFINFQIN